jgi:hypothetical protein
MNHLREANLIHRCYKDENGWWRIPYNVAIEIASPEALTVELPKKKPRGVHAEKRKLSKKEAEKWDEYVAELMEENKPQRRPPLSSREHMGEEAVKRVNEEFQDDLRRAKQLIEAGITPQMYFQWLQQNQGLIDTTAQQKEKETKDETTTQTAN